MKYPPADEGTVEFVRVMLAARRSSYCSIAKLIGRSPTMVRHIALRLGLASGLAKTCP